jgi:hypothetical protein
MPLINLLSREDAEMRHEQISAKDSYTRVEVAAVWPARTGSAVEQPAHPFEGTAAAPDVPASVGVMIASSYVALVGTFALATVASAYSVYMITISFLFLAAYITVPYLFFRQERSNIRRPSLDRFLRQGMDTLTGHCSGRAALVQMMIVPVFLTLGAAGMGIAAAIIM